ncbi:hypothetical protein ElyMa_000198500 [Elysia marginata]|uniref:Uncharacterized protein n=1 Tax=Elysia marginata TaxID=1093978 RepID=A0AAV4EYE2_9GAST|nr:hypothetical protein ElyMa_000198500 [Elysia marginata]
MNRHSRGFKLLQLAQERAKRRSDSENVFTQQETPTLLKGDSSILQPTTSTPRHSVGNISRGQDANIPLADLSFSSFLNMSFDINDVLEYEDGISLSWDGKNSKWDSNLSRYPDAGVRQIREVENENNENVHHFYKDVIGGTVVDDGVNDKIVGSSVWADALDGNGNEDIMNGTENVDHDGSDVVDDGIKNGVEICDTGSRVTSTVSEGAENGVVVDDTGNLVLDDHESGGVVDNIEKGVGIQECDDQINNLDVDGGVQGKDANGNTGGGGVDDRCETVDGGEAVHVDEAGVQVQQGDTQNVSVGRKRKADPAKWQKSINKKRREQGLSYTWWKIYG